MTLSRILDGVAYKRLVACDLPKRHSNQHELTGVSALRGILGTATKYEGKLTWALFTDAHQSVPEEHKFTLYDARAKGAARTGRSEWKLYYYGDFLSRAAIGDLLVLAKAKKRGLLGLIFAQASEAYREVISLLEINLDDRLRSITKPFLETRKWDENGTPLLTRWLRQYAIR